MNDWDNLRIVLAIQRVGSIAAAARVLKLNYSTVNRRLSAYEKQIGAKIFEKIATGQRATTLGSRICMAAERIEQEVSVAERYVLGKDQNLEGDLRLTMPFDFYHAVLAPDIADFARKYPDIRLTFSFSGAVVDLSKREADIAFRFSNNPPDTLVGIRLAKCARADYASPAYLAEHVNGTERNWIGWGEPTQRPQWVQSSLHPQADIKHHAFNDLAQLEMAANGMGMARISCFLGDQDDRVVRIPPAKSIPGLDLWILTHEDLRNTARVGALMTFMRERLKMRSALLRGEAVAGKVKSNNHS